MLSKPPHPALYPSAYAHLDEASPRVIAVPGSQKIEWPDGTRFPSHIPRVVELKRAVSSEGRAVPSNNDAGYARLDVYSMSLMS
jgi:hypothetical protein